MTLLNALMGLGLVALAIYAGWRRRVALREKLRGEPFRLDDEAVRRIESAGTIETPEPEPLDLREIEEEERRFWEDEDWNPAEHL